MTSLLVQNMFPGRGNLRRVTRGQDLDVTQVPEPPAFPLPVHEPAGQHTSDRKRRQDADPLGQGGPHQSNCFTRLSLGKLY